MLPQTWLSDNHRAYDAIAWFRGGYVADGGSDVALWSRGLRLRLELEMPDADTDSAFSTVVLAPLTAFGVTALNPGFVGDAGLSTALNALITSAHLGNRKFSFALVDLTDDPVNTPNSGLNKPAFAGVRDTDYGTVASLAKLLPLYGSYQLRYDLRQYINEQSDAGHPIPDLATLAQQVRDIYRNEWGAAELSQNIPLIEKIFAPWTPPAKLDFWRGSETGSVLDGIEAADPRGARTRVGTGAATRGLLRNTTNLAYELDPSIGSPGLARLHFFEQLRLMAGWSSDISAAIVIEALGFPYLWRLTKESRLFRPTWDPIGQAVRRGPKGGLYIALDYWFTHWDDDQPGWSKHPTDAPWADGTFLHPYQGGTARSVATLMTALAQDKLVGDGLMDFDPDAHPEMRELLRKDKSFFPLWPEAEKSPIGEGISGAKPDWDVEQTPWPGTAPPENLAVSKIGLLVDEPHNSNAVLVRATRPAGVPIKAVLVGINRLDSTDSPLFRFGAGAAGILDTRHPG